MAEPMTAQNVIAAHEAGRVCPANKAHQWVAVPPSIRGEIFFFGDGHYNGEYFNTALARFGVGEYIADNPEDANSLVFIVDQEFSSREEGGYRVLETGAPVTVTERTADLYFCVVMLDVGEYFPIKVHVRTSTSKRRHPSGAYYSDTVLAHVVTWHYFEEEIGIEMKPSNDGTIDDR
jgi:hypothetical protein